MQPNAGKTNWRYWKITDEQAAAIRAGDIPARNRFYADNLSQLRSMAWNYSLTNPRCRGLFEDMLFGVWVDMSVFEHALRRPVVDGWGLTHFVYRSFSLCPFGGLAYLTEHNPKLFDRHYWYDPCSPSLNQPVRVASAGKAAGEDGSLLADLLPARFSFDDDETEIEEMKAAVCPFLPPRQAEFFGYYMDGYRLCEIGEKMGIRSCHVSTYFKALCNTLQRKQSAVLSALAARGYSYIQGVV